MRKAIPDSLLLVSLMPIDTSDIVVKGPYSSVIAVDDDVMGRSYPDEDGDFSVIASYDHETERWFSDGLPLLMWSVASIADLECCGGPKELQKLQWVRSEFPTEDV